MRSLFHYTKAYYREQSWVHYWELRFGIEPRDIWVGVYWKRYPSAISLFICIVPMLPINIYVQWH